MDPEGPDLWRIGDKLVSRERLFRAIDRLMEMRARGLSQQEVARSAGVDRSFVSRLESLGEVRRGSRVAVVGFPVANKAELEAAARQAGAELVFLMTNEERWRHARERPGDQLFNELMEYLSILSRFDRVIFLGSDMRIRLVEAILGSDRVIGVSLGPSPITKDAEVDPHRIAALISGVKSS
ncbi:MAG: helix-turn-helix transcriptional regulator [Bacillota bacterium]